MNFCWQALKKGKKSEPVETETLEDLGARRALKGQPGGPGLDLAEEIAKLSPEFRQVLVKRELESKSYQEIARELKLAPGTVMSRLARARQELSRRLKKKKALFGLFWD